MNDIYDITVNDREKELKRLMKWELNGRLLLVIESVTRIWVALWKSYIFLIKIQNDIIAANVTP